MRTTYLGTLGVALLLLAGAVALTAAGVVGSHVAPLWNPGVLVATALGPAFAAPRMPLRALLFGGAALGLIYGGVVLCAAAVGGGSVPLEPARLLTQAAALGAVPPVAAGALYRWLERHSGRSGSSTPPAA